MLKKRVLERLVRSFSNHRRIEMLDLLETNPELYVVEISERLKMNLKTVSEYTRRLTIAGLIMKKSQGKYIRHRITPRGMYILTFLRTLE